MSDLRDQLREILGGLIRHPSVYMGGYWAALSKYDKRRVDDTITAILALPEIAEAQDEIARCHVRLEIDHAYKMDPGTGKLVRFEIPYAERMTFPDAVECRDASIKLLEDRLDEE